MRPNYVRSLLSVLIVFVLSAGLLAVSGPAQASDNGRAERRSAADQIPNARSSADNSYVYADTITLPASGCRNYPLNYAVVPSFNFYMGRGSWSLNWTIYDSAGSVSYSGSKSGYDGYGDPTDGTEQMYLCSYEPGGVWTISWDFSTEGVYESDSTTFAALPASSAAPRPPAPSPVAKPTPRFTLSASARDVGNRVSYKIRTRVKVNGRSLRNKRVAVYTAIPGIAAYDRIGTVRTDSKGKGVGRVSERWSNPTRKVKVKVCVKATSTYKAACSPYRAVRVRR